MTKTKGVLLINLGTPDSPTPKAVRKYLKVFLGDQRVIQMPKLIWWPLLNGIILPIRSKKSAALYQSIWTSEGSPLLTYTKKQTERLQASLPDYDVKYAMSYSNPTIAQVLSEFEAAGIMDLTIIPLYPQYSTTTTGSVYDDILKFYLKRQKQPTLRLVSDFLEIPLYAKAMGEKIQQALDKYPVDQVVLSYHGIPKSYVEKGDPYDQRCQLCTQLIMQEVTTKVDYCQTYQSKFGPNEWLQPATDETLKTLPQKGVKNVLVVTPSFVADCLETLEEIESENKNYFIENGGQNFNVVRPFNDDLVFNEILKTIVLSQK